jgi:hypothetical protein
MHMSVRALLLLACASRVAGTARCASSVLTLDADASDASDESLKLPRVEGIRAITLWAYVYTTQDSYVWDYLLDAREGLSDGWIAYVGYPTVRFGTGWAKAIVDTGVVGERMVSVDPFTWPMRMPGGRWMHMYFEATHAFDDDLTIFSRYTTLEDLSGDFLGVSLWRRPLSVCSLRPRATCANPATCVTTRQAPHHGADTPATRPTCTHARVRHVPHAPHATCTRATPPS